MQPSNLKWTLDAVYCFPKAAVISTALTTRPRITRRKYWILLDLVCECRGALVCTSSTRCCVYLYVWVSVSVCVRARVCKSVSLSILSLSLSVYLSRSPPQGGCRAGRTAACLLWSDTNGVCQLRLCQQHSKSFPQTSESFKFRFS